MSERIDDVDAMKSFLHLALDTVLDIMLRKQEELKEEPKAETMTCEICKKTLNKNFGKVKTLNSIQFGMKKIGGQTAWVCISCL